MPSGRSNAREALFPQRWLRFTGELKRISSAWLFYPRQSVSDQVWFGCTEWDRSLRTPQNCLFRWNSLWNAIMPKVIYKTHHVLIGWKTLAFDSATSKSKIKICLTFFVSCLGSFHVVVRLLWSTKNGQPVCGSILISHPGGRGSLVAIVSTGDSVFILWYCFAPEYCAITAATDALKGPFDDVL